MSVIPIQIQVKCSKRRFITQEERVILWNILMKPVKASWMSPFTSRASKKMSLLNWRWPTTTPLVKMWVHMWTTSTRVKEGPIFLGSDVRLLGLSKPTPRKTESLNQDLKSPFQVKIFVRASQQYSVLRWLNRSLRGKPKQSWEILRFRVL